MGSKQVIIFGGGGHAKVVKECLDSQRLDIIGFVDDDSNATLFELKHLGEYKPERETNANYLIAIGGNQIRKKITERVTHSYANAIHTTALLSPSSKIGVGCMIFHQAIIQADTQVGNHVIINTAAQLDHDCIIADFAHVGPGAILCGQVYIGEGTLVGAGAVILPGVKIGKWVKIGAGSVVSKNVMDNAVVAGVPAKNLIN